MTDYLTVAEVLAMHADQIDRYGGSHGVRDQGLLEAALYRPQTGYYADLIEEAAALWESLAQNHPFIDGDKRTAFAATYTFLAINGARLTADAQETYVFVAALYEAHQFSFDKLVPWLRSHVTQDPPADPQQWSTASRWTIEYCGSENELLGPGEGEEFVEADDEAKPLSKNNLTGEIPGTA
jgi:death-on-curing protein